MGEMHDEDGYALIRRVREIDPDVPAGALTAHAGPEDRRPASSTPGFTRTSPSPSSPATSRSWWRPSPAAASSRRSRRIRWSNTPPQGRTPR